MGLWWRKGNAFVFFKWTVVPWNRWHFSKAFSGCHSLLLSSEDGRINCDSVWKCCCSVFVIAIAFSCWWCCRYTLYTYLHRSNYRLGSRGLLLLFGSLVFINPLRGIYMLPLGTIYFHVFQFSQLFLDTFCVFVIIVIGKNTNNGWNIQIELLTHDSEGTSKCKHLFQHLNNKIFNYF